MTHAELAGTLLLQLVVLLLACRAVGWIASKFQQPEVIAEMIAGFVLGPSVFGLFAPDLSYVWQRSHEPALDPALSADRLS